MDWLKYPFEKLIFFVAAIVPGSVLLLIAHLQGNTAVGWLCSNGFLGYRTKLASLLLIAFVLGYSVTTMTKAIIGGIYGARAHLHPMQYQPSTSFKVAPWRDPRWRSLLATYLGPKAPSDTRLLDQDLYELRKRGIGFLAIQDQASALHALDAEKLGTEMDDHRWEQWYSYFHELLLRPDEKDWWFQISWGININLQTTSIIALIAAIFVPQFRHWWVISISLMWLVLLFAVEYTGFVNSENKWSTLTKQIEFLSKSEAVIERTLASKAKSAGV